MQAGQDLYARVGDSGHQDRYGVFLATRAPTATCAATRWATRLPRRQARHRFLQPGRLLDAHRAGRLVHRHRHHGQPPESQSQVHGGDTSSTKGRAFTASVEAGLPIALKPNLSLEPQAQIIYQNTRIDSVRDSASDVSFAPKNALIGRVGAAAGRVPGQGRHLEALCAGGPGAHAGRTRQGRLQRRHHQHVGHGRHPGAPGTGRLGQGQRAGQRLRLGGIWLQPGRRAARNGAGQPGVRINW